MHHWNPDLSHLRLQPARATLISWKSHKNSNCALSYASCSSNWSHSCSRSTARFEFGVHPASCPALHSCRLLGLQPDTTEMVEFLSRRSCVSVVHFFSSCRSFRISPTSPEQSFSAIHLRPSASSAGKSLLPNSSRKLSEFPTPFALQSPIIQAPKEPFPCVSPPSHSLHFQFLPLHSLPPSASTTSSRNSSGSTRPPATHRPMSNSRIHVPVGSTSA